MGERPSEKQTIKLVEKIRCWSGVQFDINHCGDGDQVHPDPRDDSEECNMLWESVFNTTLMVDGSTSFGQEIRYAAIRLMILIVEGRKDATG